MFRREAFDGAKLESGVEEEEEMKEQDGKVDEG